MDNIKLLSEKAKAKRQTFLAMRKAGVGPDLLKTYANKYIDAVEEWHKAAKPKKKFYRPSFGYLMRAL